MEKFFIIEEKVWLDWLQFMNIINFCTISTQNLKYILIAFVLTHGNVSYFIIHANALKDTDDFISVFLRFWGLLS